MGSGNVEASSVDHLLVRSSRPRAQCDPKLGVALALPVEFPGQFVNNLIETLTLSSPAIRPWFVEMEIDTMMLSGKVLRG